MQCTVLYTVCQDPKEVLQKYCTIYWVCLINHHMRLIKNDRNIVF